MAVATKEASEFSGLEGLRKRKVVLDELGCEIVNNQWQWSFVNHQAKRVYFTGWMDFPEDHPTPTRWIVADHNNSTGPRGNPRLGYNNNIKHVRLVREEGYSAFVLRSRGSKQIDATGRRRVKLRGVFGEPVPGHLTDDVENQKIWFDATPGTVELTVPEKGLPQSADPGRVEQTVSRYEANPENRRECLRIHGTTCNACGIPMEAVYGPEMTGLIEAHHLIPRSQLPEGHVADIATEYASLCPNCHAAAHYGPGKTTNPRSIAELRELLAIAKRKRPASGPRD